MKYTVLLCLLALCGLAPASRPVHADVPIPPVQLIPGALTIASDGFVPWGGFEIEVHDLDDLPYPGALVELRFDPGTVPNSEGLVAWAVGQARPLVSGVTDVNGRCTFYIQGSGCISSAAYQGTTVPVQIFADGILLAEIPINSPDAVNSAGLLPTDTNGSRPNGASNCEDGHSEVGISDAVFHTQAITAGLTEFCSNFTEPFDDAVNLADAVIIASYVTTGSAFSCD